MSEIPSPQLLQTPVDVDLLDADGKIVYMAYIIGYLGPGLGSVNLDPIFEIDYPLPDTNGKYATCYLNWIALALRIQSGKVPTDLIRALPELVNVVHYRVRRTRS